MASGWHGMSLSIKPMNWPVPFTPSFGGGHRPPKLPGTRCAGQSERAIPGYLCRQSDRTDRPAIGKRAWARALGNLISAPTMFYEAINESASFGLVSPQRSWGSANSGRLIDTILAHRVANLVVAVDEV